VVCVAVDACAGACDVLNCVAVFCHIAVGVCMCVYADMCVGESACIDVYVCM